ncbi:rCG51467 [Rattus norvegicus]|uniref:RCG51467 n=1 Tax=Rattus norvegicus TaxID=10116 RepID=A6IZN5_RAT|nr:rCG51467 [Rattus norvegicus]
MRLDGCLSGISSSGLLCLTWDLFQNGTCSKQCWPPGPLHRAGQHHHCMGLVSR